jgi:hypothetical protein
MSWLLYPFHLADFQYGDQLQQAISLGAAFPVDD